MKRPERFFPLQFGLQRFQIFFQFPHRLIAIIRLFLQQACDDLLSPGYYFHPSDA